MINIRLTDILETGSQYTKNIPLAFACSALFLYEFLNVLPSFFNSSILSLDSSLLVNLSKEIVLFLNTLRSLCDEASEGSNTKTLILSLNYNNFDSILAEHSTEQIPSGSTVASLNFMPDPQVSVQYIKTLNIPNVFSYISNQNIPETVLISTIQIVSVAYSLYTYGASWFLLLGLILLLAMIAPIYLSRK